MWPVDLSRSALAQHSVDLRQFIDFRQSSLPNGLRLVEAYNSSGLTFTLLPDRGLDIWTAAFNGLPLTWISQNSPHPPDHGATWLRQFNGGLLVTCGLRHVGQPEADDVTGERRDLHGDYTRLRAGALSSHGAWEGDRYVLALTGSVAEASFFGDQLRLTRTVRMALGEPWVEVTDQVANVGDAPAPLMHLHHINFGYPLVHDGVELLTATVTAYPADENARRGAPRRTRYDGATAQRPEEVFFHHVRVDAGGMSLAALADDEFGVAVEWDARQAPYLTQWKNFRQTLYLNGVEPGNCLPEGLNRARREGRLVRLEPGATRTMRSRITVLPDRTAVAAVRRRVADLDVHGAPAAVHLADYAA